MSGEVKFTNNKIKVKKAINDKCLQWLEEASGEVEAQVKRNTAVMTGKTKGAWTHIVDGNKLEGIIGNPEENSVWEEFGTGEFALKGDGRKTAWSYKDKITGKWYKTKGKKPKRALYRAFKSTKQILLKLAENIFEGLNDD